MPDDHPIVRLARGAAGDLGRGGKVAGLDSWHDAATFTPLRHADRSFGPDGIDSAHAVDEYVSVDSLVDACAAIALIAMRWCGVQG